LTILFKTWSASSRLSFMIKNPSLRLQGLCKGGAELFRVYTQDELPIDTRGAIFMLVFITTLRFEHAEALCNRLNCLWCACCCFPVAVHALRHHVSVVPAIMFQWYPPSSVSGTRNHVSVVPVFHRYRCFTGTGVSLHVNLCHHGYIAVLRATVDWYSRQCDWYSSIG
jgi:hypothetical protein